MASLNTLRTKGGWFLTIIIAVALLGFILSDANFTGGGNQNPRVGEIAGQKIKYMDFMSERAYQESIMRAMYGVSSMDEQESETLAEMTWQNMIVERAYAPGFRKLGISVSDDEQADMATGFYLSPVITSSFVDQQTGEFNPALLRQFVDNLAYDNTGQNQMIWDFVKQQMDRQRMVAKYMAVAGGGVWVNRLDMEAGLRDDNMKYSARVVMQPYESIADSSVSVSDSEIRDYYRRNKNQFRQQASREVEYVTFAIAPSAEDLEAGRQKAEELAAGLAATDSPLQYALANSTGDRNLPLYIGRGDMDPAMAEAVIGNPGAVYGPVADGETFVVARMGEQMMVPDSVTVNLIQLAAGQQALADSLVTVIKGGTPFAEMAMAHSVDMYSAQMGGTVGTLDPAGLETNMPELFTALVNSKKGDLLNVATRGGIYIVQVADMRAASPKYKVAVIRHRVYASSATQSAAQARANEFYNSAAGSYDNFVDAADGMSLMRRYASVAPGERSIDGLENSLEMVRWATESRRHDVSEPMSIGRDNIVVAVVRDSREHGIGTVQEVAYDIRQILLNEKKAAMLAERMAGASLDEIAARLGTIVIEQPEVYGSLTYLPSIGMEPRLVGAICSAENFGALGKPVRGEGGVFLFEVTGAEDAANTTESQERVKLHSAAAYYINDRTTEALLEESDIQDTRVLYF